MNADGVVARQWWGAADIDSAGRWQVTIPLGLRHPADDPHLWEPTGPDDGNSGTAGECRLCGWGPECHGAGKKS